MTIDSAPTKPLQIAPKPRPRVAALDDAPSRGFDASEGTPLDPLLNKSWDLNSGHDVPDMK